MTVSTTLIDLPQHVQGYAVYISCLASLFLVPVMTQDESLFYISVICVYLTVIMQHCDCCSVAVRSSCSHVFNAVV